MNEQIGFIGLGSLGLPVAANLMKAGYSLVVYNRTESKAAPLAAKGATLALRPADVVTAGGIVVTVLWDDDALESVVTSTGFLEKLGPEGIHISMSTVSPETSKKLAAMHARHGSFFVEAPIFGRPEAAEAQKLSIPITGPQTAKERVLPLLKAMGGQDIFDFGETVGAANIVKLIGNFMISAAVRSMTEALSMAEKSGVDPKPVVDMLTNTLFSAPIYKSYGKMYVDKTLTFNRSRIGLKDMGTFIKTAERVESPVPVANLLYDLITKE